MKKFKKLLALGLSVGVLASSMICASAVRPTPSLEELIDQAERRFTRAIRVAGVPDDVVNAQRGQVVEALGIYNELCCLRDSGEDVSDDVLDKYVQSLEAIGVEF